jgi:sialic acid synthase SpsE
MSYIKRLKEYGFNTDNKVYVIAEIGINHSGNIETAKKLIDSAVRAGVNAVKFQTYITEKRTFKGSPIFDILKKCELSFESFKVLKDYAEKKKVDFFSTPFDEESIEYLTKIGCSIIKIASFDVVNTKFLETISRTGKTFILSVGMSNLNEIRSAYNILRKGSKNISILHCISAYPTNEEDANIGAIYELKKEFDCVIGQSDHTNGIKVPLYAVAAGAQVIEKHFMIDENFDCPDKVVSITESQMSNLVKEIRQLEKIIGDGQLGVTECQTGTLQFRRIK